MVQRFRLDGERKHTVELQASLIEAVKDSERYTTDRIDETFGQSRPLRGKDSRPPPARTCTIEGEGVFVSGITEFLFFLSQNCRQYEGQGLNRQDK